MPDVRVRSIAHRVVAVAAALMAVGAFPGAASAEPKGTLLVDEPFTGTSADARFLGYGDACLTGAVPGTPPPPGTHSLAGCPTNRSGPVPPGGGAPFGFLQLTDANNDQSGAALFEQAIPATEGLEVTFDQYQYGSTTPIADADGISFFLVDGAGTLSSPGAFGGSLGYAQKLPDDNPANPFIPGVENGYLGIGLDVLGNYFGDWEHRGNGCATRSPSGTAFYVPAPGRNMVTVRGPGNGLDGYCFMTATTNNFTTTGPWPSTLPGQLQGPLTAFPSGVTPQEAYNLLQPSKRTVTVQVTPAPAPRVTVDIDFNDGAGAQRVIDFAAPENVPDTYKFGFAGSTGLFTDVHLIGNVTVRSTRPLPLLDLVKSADTSKVYKVGDVVDYTYTVTNLTGVPVPGIAVVDDRAMDIVCDATDLAPAGDPGDSTTCTGHYLITPDDVEDGQVTNIAYATGDNGNVRSPDDDVTVTTGTSPTEPPTSPPTTPPSGSPGPLPITGAAPWAFTAAGVALLMAGVIITAMARRRAREG